MTLARQNDGRNSEVVRVPAHIIESAERTNSITFSHTHRDRIEHALSAYTRVRIKESRPSERRRQRRHLGRIVKQARKLRKELEATAIDADDGVEPRRLGVPLSALDNDPFGMSVRVMASQANGAADTTELVDLPNALLKLEISANDTMARLSNWGRQGEDPYLAVVIDVLYEILLTANAEIDIYWDVINQCYRGKTMTFFQDVIECLPARVAPTERDLARAVERSLNLDRKVA